MEKLVKLMFFTLLALGFSACSNDDEKEDASVMRGIWEYKDKMTVTVETNQQEVSALIEKHLREICFSNFIHFENNGECTQSFIKDDKIITGFRGNYFRSEGDLYVQFMVTTNYGCRKAWMEIIDTYQNVMEFNFDARDMYNDEKVLAMLGVETPSQVNVSKVKVVMEYGRKW